MHSVFWDSLGRHNIMAESGSPGKSEAGSYTSLSQKDNEETENDVFLLSKKQESYIKDTTDLVRFNENTPLPDNAIIATLDVCSYQYPTGRRDQVVCQYYNKHYLPNAPIPTPTLGDLMKLILKENLFHFNDINTLPADKLKQWAQKWQ